MRILLIMAAALMIGCIHVSDQNMCDRQMQRQCVHLANAECSREFIAAGRYDQAGYQECTQLRWLSMCSGTRVVNR